MVAARQKRGRGRKARSGGTKSVKLTITGEVQDVGFRLRLLREAQRLSLPQFFADNLPDGRTVEAYVGGRADAVDDFVATVKGMRAGNPGTIRVSVEPYRGNIQGIRDYVDYLHTEQLSKGVEAVTVLGQSLTAVAKDFADGMATGFRRLDERLDELPAKVADQVRRR